MTRPTILPKFAAAAAVGDISTPSVSKQDSGWVKVGGTPEKPPYQEFNWIHQHTYNWIKYFSDIITEPSAGVIEGSINIITSDVIELNSDGGVPKVALTESNVVRGYMFADSTTAFGVIASDNSTVLVDVNDDGTIIAGPTSGFSGINHALNGHVRLGGTTKTVSSVNYVSIHSNRAQLLMGNTTDPSSYLFGGVYSDGSNHRATLANRAGARIGISGATSSSSEMYTVRKYWDGDYTFAEGDEINSYVTAHSIKGDGSHTIGVSDSASNLIQAAAYPAIFKRGDSADGNCLVRFFGSSDSSHGFIGASAANSFTNVDGTGAHTNGYCTQEGNWAFTRAGAFSIATPRLLLKAAGDSYQLTLASDNGTGDNVYASWLTVNSAAANYVALRLSTDAGSSFVTSHIIYGDGGHTIGAPSAGGAHLIQSSSNTPLTIKKTSTGTVAIAIDLIRYDDALVSTWQADSTNCFRVNNSSDVQMFDVSQTGKCRLGNAYSGNNTHEMWGSLISDALTGTYTVTTSPTITINFAGREPGMFLVTASRTNGSVAVNGIWWVGYSGGASGTVTIYNTLALNNLTASTSGTYFILTAGASISVEVNGLRMVG